jgi:cobalamin biosynthetic protein CobC
MGPWAVAGPSREAAKLALRDRDWQTAQRPRLLAASQRLHNLLAPLGEVKSTALFTALTTPHSVELHECLARQGILTRRFEQQPLLRFGLPANETGWQRLTNALGTWKPA